MATLDDPPVREFLSHGTRTGSLAYLAPSGRPLVDAVEDAYRSAGAISARPPVPGDADAQTVLARFGRLARGLLVTSSRHADVALGIRPPGSYSWPTRSLNTWAAGWIRVRSATDMPA